MNGYSVFAAPIGYTYKKTETHSKLRLTDKLTQHAQPKSTMGEIFELLKHSLSSPWNIYENGSLNVKKTILKTAFKAPLAHDRENGFRAPQASVIFEFFEKSSAKFEMAHSGRQTSNVGCSRHFCEMPAACHYNLEVVGLSKKGPVVRSERLELSRVLPHSDLNAARLPFRHDRT